MIWFGWVLWHINHCRLFHVKSSLYIYIKCMIWFDWVYSILTIVGYLISNHLYTHIYSICMICKHILLITFSDEPDLIHWHTVKWFQVLLCNHLTPVIHLYPYKYIDDTKEICLSVISFLNEL